MSDPQVDPLLDAALALAAERGWPAVTLDDAASASGLDGAAARRAVGCKAGLLRRILERTDAAMLAALDEDAGDPAIPVRDRLFDVLMTRFDVLTPHREGFVAILRGLPRSPASALTCLPALGRSMGRVLEAVGQSPRPPLGPLKVKGLAVVWLATLRVWMTDESEDLAATMKALDSNLARAEEMANSLLPGGREAATARDAP